MEYGIDLGVEELSGKREGRIFHRLEGEILLQDREKIAEIEAYMVEISFALPPLIERQIP